MKTEIIDESQDESGLKEREYLEEEKTLYKESEETKRGKRLRPMLRLNIDMSCKDVPSLHSPRPTKIKRNVKVKMERLGIFIYFKIEV